MDGDGVIRTRTVVARDNYGVERNVLFEPTRKDKPRLVTCRGAVLTLVVTIPVTAERAISAMYFGDKEAGLWLRTTRT